MVRKYKIRKAIKDDEKWVIEIFRENKKILGGAGYGKLQWKRFWDNEKNNEHWIVIESVCFCHYLTRIKDGVNVVYEIATKSSEKRKGFGRKMIDYIGKPISLKTDFDSKESNYFYKKIGFKEIGISYTKSSNKKMQNYEYTDIKGLFDE
jgi:N-acetylglutamate synthase-like GNAT family acetyltransferase